MLILVTPLVTYGPFNTLKAVREKVASLDLEESCWEVQLLWI